VDWTQLARTELIKDYKETTLLHALSWPLLISLFTFIGAVLWISPSFGADYEVCRPDNKFDTSGTTYNVWKPSNVFEVTIGFGELSFGVAKLIDVIWDVVGVLYCFVQVEEHY
jgi:hypothetical protein